MRNLTEKRAADRKAMAQAVIECATANGCAAAIDPLWSRHSPRAIMVRIEAPGGAHVSIEFDGETTQPDVHVWTWNSDRRFGAGWGHDAVNPFHRRKASRVSDGLEQLLATLAADCAGLVSGDRYE